MSGAGEQRFVAGGSVRSGRGGPGLSVPPDLRTRILVIEDEGVIAWMLESLLKDMGFTDVEIASNAAEAFEMASEWRPGLLVSDINLGLGADGVEAVAAIRRTVPVPALFVTAYADDATHERVRREVPFAPLLRKPIERDELRRAVIAALAGEVDR